MSARSQKPRLFVGSSVESLKFARAVSQNLDPHDALVKVWPEGVFNIGEVGLDSLLEAVKSHDFGAFIFAADDVATMRKKRYNVVRDNVILELGLFMGRLGRERTFIITPSGVKLHLPTDLSGLNAASYDPNREDLVANLGVACDQIRLAMRRLGVFQPESSTSGLLSLAPPIEVPPPFGSTVSAGVRRKTVIRYPAARSKAPAGKTTP